MSLRQAVTYILHTPSGTGNLRGARVASESHHAGGFTCGVVMAASVRFQAARISA